MEKRTPERKQRIERVLQRKQPDLTVVLENVHDQHNVMAVLRTCDAVGVFEVHVIESVEGRWDPRLGKNSSSGAKKWVGIHKYPDVDSCYEVLRQQGKMILTTHMSDDSKSLYDIDLTQPIALVFGNEHSGVTEEAVAKADGNFIIPQMGLIKSLNISVACAVTLFEAFRQRDAKDLYDQSSFDGDQYDLLLKDWLSR